jgi:transposase
MGAEITIPLDIPNVRVLQVEINNRGDCTITVESTMEGTRCRQCRREITDLHGVDDGISLRPLPILGCRVYIRIRPKRYRCPYCEGGPTTSQPLEWYSAKSPNTKAYEKYLLLRLVNATVEDVSLKEEIGYKAVEAILDRSISREVNWEEFRKVKTLGLDEIALKKGHRDFVVLVTTRSAQGEVSVVAVLPDRKKHTVRQFLEAIPQRVKRSIRTVCTDLYEGFIHAVQEVLGKARVVADRYHVAKLYREGADQFRKQETRRLKKALSPKAYAEIKGAMWAFRKKPADWEAEERQLLQRLFSYSPALKQAYNCREKLTAIFDAELSKAAATQKIKNWRKRVQASRLKCFDRFFATLDNWMEEITNYFLDRSNSGFVEGLNNKIKVLKRRCYGIFNLSHLFQRIFLDLEGYRLFARTDS